MDGKFVKEFEEGDKIEVELLLTSATKGVSNNGSPYLSLSLQDRTGSIDGKKWDASEEDYLVAQIGTVIKVKADVIDYRNASQLKITNLELVDQSTVDFTRFCIPSPIPQEELIRKLRNYISGIKDADCSNIVNTIINKYFDQFVTYPAATKNHHEFASGLLYHTVSMADIASMLCSYYDDIDKDMLMSGVILHDVGKIFELSGPIATKYTVEGKLIGHISIMVSEIRKTAEVLNIHSEVPLLLEHMILSHHGEKDYGSPVPPLTKEAFLLHYIDDLDAKMNILSKALTNVEEGEFSTRVMAMDGRAFYKPKNRK